LETEKLKNGLPIQQDVRTIDFMRKFNPKNDLAWEAGFANLLAYCAENGTALVPKGHRLPNGYDIGGWVYRQRSNSDRLTPEQRTRIGSVPGWAWSAHDAAWEAGFAHLLSYSAEHGTAAVPNLYKTDDFRLGTWAAYQRNWRETMAPDRKSRLEALTGWKWDLRPTHNDEWDTGFSHLQAYCVEHGNAAARINYTSPDGYKLGPWLVTQRSIQKSMPPSRIARLESLPGWLWKFPHFTHVWETGFAHLTSYIAEHGSSHFPRGTLHQGFNLSGWVACQRRNKDTMLPARRSRLEAVSCWVWNAQRFSL
jgi:hypothetical protein